jgi:N-acetylglutamate synthase-like GNAT family acetyltransferase
MQIHQASDDDIPAIVTLLKASLGESLLPKSESYWRWKHELNPFGKSFVLVAQEDQAIVGVRAFMRWAWQRGNERIEAVRAVDTATHPKHQGKGIFNKLTLAMVEHCKNQNIKMVYNTPNDKSMPGYLKMGWVKAGKLPISISVKRPVSMGLRFITKKKEHLIAHQDTPHLTRFLNHPGLSALLETDRIRQGSFFKTPYTQAALRWRYLSVPSVTYGAGGIEQGSDLKALFICRLKSSRFGSELRVTDIFAKDSAVIPELKKHINQMASECNADYVVIDGFKTGHNLFKTEYPIGPIVTVKNIAMDHMLHFLQFSSWKPSIGDLELF